MKLILKSLKVIGIILVLLYLMACLILYFAQEQFLFDPHNLDESRSLRTGYDYEIKVDDDVELNIVEVLGNIDQKVILYLHGNRGHNRRGLYQSRLFNDRGEGVIIPDYRSYGKSQGSIQSEMQLFGDMQIIYDQLAAKYGEENIVVLGYSLGTSMASYLAANNNPARLILVAPFTSMIDIKNRYAWFMPDFLLKYPLDNTSRIAKVSCPIHIVHGTDDELIPFSMSEELESLNPDRIELVEAKGESHRSVIFSGALGELCRRLFGTAND